MLDHNTPIQNCVTPGCDKCNEWGTHNAKYGIGGFQVINTENDIGNIKDCLKDGKMVFIKNLKEYRYWNGTEWENPNGIDFSGGISTNVSIRQLTNNFLLEIDIDQEPARRFYIPIDIDRSKIRICAASLLIETDNDSYIYSMKSFNYDNKTKKIGISTGFNVTKGKLILIIHRV